MKTDSLVALPHLRGLEVVCNEIWVVIWARGMRNRWIHHFCSEFMVVDHFLRWPCMWCYFGISWCTPVIQKIGQCHVTFWGRPHGIALPEFAMVQHWGNALDFNSGGVLQSLTSSFCNLARWWWWPIGYESSFAESWSKYDTLLFK